MNLPFSILIMLRATAAFAVYLFITPIIWWVGPDWLINFTVAMLALSFCTFIGSIGYHFGYSVERPSFTTLTIDPP